MKLDFQACSNWDKRFDEDWIPENNIELLSGNNQKDKITFMGVFLVINDWEAEKVG